MTVTERNAIVVDWGGKHCPHPQFEDVESGETEQDRACLQCGELLDEIVSATSHADFIIPTSQSIESLATQEPVPQAPEPPFPASDVDKTVKGSAKA